MAPQPAPTNRELAAGIATFWALLAGTVAAIEAVLGHGVLAVTAAVVAALAMALRAAFRTARR